MSIDTTVSRLAEQNMQRTRIEEEAARVRAAEDKATEFDAIKREHPEDALAVACCLRGLGGAK
jgi:hypothetical protein